MQRAPQQCKTPGCFDEATDRGRCRTHHLQYRKARDQGRPSAHQRGYNAEWQRTRARYLRDHPTCECDACLALAPADRLAAVDVHHDDGRGPLGPRGHDPSNLRALSHKHHSQHTALHQPGGFASG